MPATGAEFKGKAKMPSFYKPAPAPKTPAKKETHWPLLLGGALAGAAVLLYLRTKQSGTTSTGPVLSVMPNTGADQSQIQNMIGTVNTMLANPNTGQTTNNAPPTDSQNQLPGSSPGNGSNSSLGGHNPLNQWSPNGAYAAAFGNLPQDQQNYLASHGVNAGNFDLGIYYNPRAPQQYSPAVGLAVANYISGQPAGTFPGMSSQDVSWNQQYQQMRAQAAGITPDQQTAANNLVASWISGKVPFGQGMNWGPSSPTTSDVQLTQAIVGTQNANIPGIPNAISVAGLSTDQLNALNLLHAKGITNDQILASGGGSYLSRVSTAIKNSPTTYNINLPAPTG